MRHLFPILRRLEIRRAVGFNILGQGWMALAGPVILVIIAHFMTKELQGYYYTFSSVLALQILAELGLSTVIVQVASHEWALLKVDADGIIIGDRRSLLRLGSWLRFTSKWYAVAGLIVGLILSIGGYLFFMVSPDQGISWQLPWLLLCAVGAANLQVTPLIAVLDGCDQVDATYANRLLTGVLHSLTLAIGVVCGAGLFAMPMAALVRLSCPAIFLARNYRQFLLQLVRQPATERIGWWNEVWPFQWRVAVSWISAYFTYSLFGPVMFYYQGAVIAGQMGMTLQMTRAVPTLAYAWLYPRLPEFGGLIVGRNYERLDSLFRRLFVIAMGTTVLGLGAVLLVTIWLHQAGFSIADRMLPPLPTGLLVAVGVIETIVNLLSLYLLAHKRDPLAWVTMTSSMLIGPSVWWLGATVGPMGAAAAYLAVTLLWRLPLAFFVFQRCRARWHKPQGNAQTSFTVAVSRSL